MGGGPWADLLRAGAGDDMLFGWTEDDLLFGDDGNDSLWGDAGADMAEGGTGNDLLSGGDGNDALSGGAGDDALRGDAGDDSLWGGGGSDALAGGAGHDRLEAAPAAGDAVWMAGGEGMDGFVIDLRASGAGGRVSIADFDPLWDRIVIRTADVILPAQVPVFARDWTAGTVTFADGDGALLLSLPGRPHGIVLDGLSLADRAAVLARLDVMARPLTEGSAAADVLSGSAHDDRMSGLAGDDRITGGDGCDSLDGGAGHDVLAGDAGHDLLSGGDGNDVLSGGTGNDTLDGGAGDDMLSGAAGADVFAVDLTLTGHRQIADFFAPHDSLFLTVPLVMQAAELMASLRIEGGSIVMGGAGASVRLVGRSSPDVLGDFNVTVLRAGHEGAESATGSAQADMMRGRGGNDTLDGGDGADSLWGDAGNDVLAGGGGADSLDGGDGDDVLTGGAGIDRLDGGAGNDRLDGGADGARMTGGGGADVFVFRFGPDSDGFDAVADLAPIDRVDVIGLNADLDRDGDTDFADLLLMAEDAGDAVVIDTGDRIIMFHGLSTADLDAAQFTFI